MLSNYIHKYYFTEDKIMANISVSIHTFNIEEISTGENKYKIKKELNNKIAKQNDIFEIIRTFCKRYGQYEDDEIKSSVFKISEESFTEEKNEETGNVFRHMILRVKTGEYGFTTDLVDPKKKEEVYKKDSDLAEVKPFFVNIVVDKRKNIQKGFIIFQNVGIYSVKTVFKTYFSDFLKSYNTQTLQYKFNIGVVTPKHFALQLLNEYEVKNLKLVAYNKPMDSADKLDSDFAYAEEERIYRKFSKIKKTVKKICEYINRERDITDIIEIEGFEYDNIKLELDLGGGKVRTLDLGKIDKAVMKLNFKDSDIKGIDGHADMDKLKKEVESIYELYSKNINLVYLK